MKRCVWLVLFLAACGCEPKPDPARLAALQRLGDPRPEARVVAINTLAQGADRAELAAIARASAEAPASVRIAAAKAFGQSTHRDAIDFLGAMLVQPDVRSHRSSPFARAHLPGDDEVRAVVVEQLASQPDDKAGAYLARAWRTGGPRMRAELARRSSVIVRRAILEESKRRVLSARTEREDARPQVRADALFALVEHGGEDVPALLEQALVEGHPLEQVAAARAVGTFGLREFAKNLWPLLTDAASEPVIEAAAEALEHLRVTEPPSSFQGFPARSEASARALLSLLESLVPSDEVRRAACVGAMEAQTAELAERAARLAGPACSLPLPSEEESPEIQARRFAALRGGARRVPELLSLARRQLDAWDAPLAAEAGAWLAMAGDSSDARRLYDVAVRERQAVIEGREDRTEAIEQKKDAVHAIAEERRLSAARAGIDLPPVVPNRLQKLLAERKFASEVETYSPRPGSNELLARSALGAARLGYDVAPFAETLLTDGDAGLRHVGVLLADVLDGAPGQRVRRRALLSDELEVALDMAIRNLDAKRDGALEDAISLLARLDEATLRVRLAQALAPHGAQAKDALLALARGNDAAVPVATWALSDVEDEAVTELFRERLRDSRAFGALDAVWALGNRAGAEVSRALWDAAFHPSADVQAAAVRALAERGDCEDPQSIIALEDAFERTVREATTKYRQACPASQVFDAGTQKR